MTDTTEERLGTNALSVARRTPKPETAQAPQEGDKADRALDDRHVTENREISEAERVEMFRRQLYTDILPNLPEIPGWHICWLTTTNRSDSIQARMRLGYEPVKPEDAPGMDLVTLKTGDYAGMIGVNEMLAFKLPMSLYQSFMRIAHHDEPLRQQEGIVANVDALKHQAQELEANLVEGDGISELRRSAPRVKAFT